MLEQSIVGVAGRPNSIINKGTQNLHKELDFCNNENISA